MCIWWRRITPAARRRRRDAVVVPRAIRLILRLRPRQALVAPAGKPAGAERPGAVAKLVVVAELVVEQAPAAVPRIPHNAIPRWRTSRVIRRSTFRMDSPRTVSRRMDLLRPAVQGDGTAGVGSGIPGGQRLLSAEAYQARLGQSPGSSVPAPFGAGALL